ncbi:MAG: HyaD/HybD family hydrogenase maturation endopeptidase [Lentisphaerae bacterium]|nr:MAG: HyaD/HybD family hydrogenase maturation endopeptidase [Lentisphaerota bacterium]
MHHTAQPRKASPRSSGVFSRSVAEHRMNITVFGIGNILLSDDGAGVHAVNMLQERFVFPDNVRIIDGGTKGLDLLPLIERQDRLLIIDAANFNKEPGTIETVEGDKIPALLSGKLSVHQIGLPDMLFAAKLMEITPPEMCLVGIQPKSMETGTELSDVVSSRMDELIGVAIEKLSDWGVEVIPRERGTE